MRDRSTVQSVAMLFGVVFLLVGILGFIPGIALSRTFEGARWYMIGGGVVYLALWILGLVGGAEWIPANDADHWLHLVLGVAMIGLGYLTTRQRLTRAAAA
jgi:hypothetical protein